MNVDPITTAIESIAGQAPSIAALLVIVFTFLRYLTTRDKLFADALHGLRQAVERWAAHDLEEEGE